MRQDGAFVFEYNNLVSIHASVKDATLQTYTPHKVELFQSTHL